MTEECFFPWFIASCVQELEDELLKPHFTAFEWGAGKSTIWLARRVQSVISVEHDKEWYDRVLRWIQDENLQNVNQAYCDLRADYVDIVTKYDNFDVIMIDGRRRADCIRASANKVNPGGFVIVDDAERPQYQKALLSTFKNGNIWNRRDWFDDAGKYTSIFFRNV